MRPRLTEGKCWVCGTPIPYGGYVCTLPSCRRRVLPLLWIGLGITGLALVACSAL